MLVDGLPERHAGVGALALIDELDGRIPVIAVGGIMSAEDAQRKLQAGASLVQLYTGFIYHGPALVSAISKEL